MSNKNIIALIYDFDGTLSPLPMQEYTVLPELGIKPADFWSDVGKEVQATGGEDIITYMRMMYERAEEKKVHIDRDKLKAMAPMVPYFEGVEDWFASMNDYIKKRSNDKIETRHYIISSGLREILEGVSIYKEFHNIFASEYFFDHHGRATYPNRVITDTTKTQYLFRINKGVEDLTKSINSHMPMKDRPIPFENMIYYGDGLTDVPSMAVTRANGGHSVAVYTPGKSEKPCQTLFKEKRCDFFAPADYSKGSDLHRRTLLILDKIIASILLQKELDTLG
ncbi:MAG: haloacid dehalogenase-like hydrolase [Hyphomicrobiaceae bacterium]|nr:haloacid dehalogenase-like hydrolase [Hyphomicrobiaceae bacterium]